MTNADLPLPGAPAMTMFGFVACPLENFEADRELQLAQEYQDVSRMFRFAVETDRRFYLANEVELTVLGLSEASA